jgi:hypothetical protein
MLTVTLCRPVSFYEVSMKLVRLSELLQEVQVLSLHCGNVLR